MKVEGEFCLRTMQGINSYFGIYVTFVWLNRNIYIYIDFWKLKSICTQSGNVNLDYNFIQEGIDYSEQ